MSSNTTTWGWETTDPENLTNISYLNDTQYDVTELPMRTIDRIQFWVTPILVSFGCLGNVVSVWVFHSSKLRTLSSSCYLAALAASDTVFLLTLFLIWLSMVDYDLLNQHGWCQAINYAIYVTTFLSVWLVVAFTVERFIAVCYPLLRAAVCTVRRARLVIVLLTLTALLLYAYLLVAAAPGVHPNAGGRVICKLREDYVELATAMNYVDTLLTLILPIFTIVILNFRIARCVWHVEKIRHSMTLAHSYSSPNSTLAADCGRRSGSTGGELQYPKNQTSSSDSTMVGGCGRRRHRIRSQNKVTKMLLIISTVFILLNLPSYVLRGYIFFWCNGDTCDKSPLFYTLQQTFTLLFYTNFAINFLLYCVTGQNFRSAVGGLCVCSLKRQDRNRRHFLSPTFLKWLTPHNAKLDRNNSGAVMINIQVWQGSSSRMASTTIFPQASTAVSRSESPRSESPNFQSQSLVITDSHIANGYHATISRLPDEKEDSF